MRFENTWPLVILVLIPCQGTNSIKSLSWWLRPRIYYIYSNKFVLHPHWRTKTISNHYFGVIRLGFLIDFLSHAAIVGFMGGAAITIALQQLKGFLGISTKKFTKKSDIISVLHSVFNTMHHGVNSLLSLSPNCVHFFIFWSCRLDDIWYKGSIENYFFVISNKG